MPAWKSNDYLFAFSCNMLGVTATAMLYPQFFLEVMNKYVIGSVFTFLSPFPVPNTPDMICMYNVLFTLGLGVNVIHNLNANNDLYVRNSIKVFSIFSLTLVGNYMAGYMRLSFDTVALAGCFLPFKMEHLLYSLFTIYQRRINQSFSQDTPSYTTCKPSSSFNFGKYERNISRMLCEGMLTNVEYILKK